MKHNCIVLCLLVGFVSRPLLAQEAGTPMPNQERGDLALQTSPTVVQKLGDGSERQRIVDAILARSSAIVSGSFDFDVISTYRPNGGEERETTRDHVEVTVSGSDWIRTYRNSPNCRISRTDYGATFTERRQPNEVPYRSLVIAGSEGDLEAGWKKEYWRRVLRCGAIPLPDMAAYIKDVRDKVTYAGSRVQDGIDVDVLEILVPSSDFGKAFYYATLKSAKHDKGILRIFVSRARGFAVVRVEYSTVNGEVDFWFEGDHFTKVAEGIFLPSVWRQVDHSDTREIVTTYRIHKASKINEPIDERAFELSLPAGTRVRDSRPGTPKRIFRLGKE